MKLWGWWKKEKEPKPEPKPEQEPQLLEDIQDSKVDRPVSQPTVAEAVKQIKLDDFKHLNSIPCMRKAFLTGAGIGAVTGLVMFLVKKRGLSFVHWSFASFLLGSVVSWEQCQYRIVRGKREMAAAQRMFKAKPERGGKDV